MALQPLTTYEILSLIVSIAGFATVIITLILTRNQTALIAKSLEGNIHQSSASQMFDVDSIFINHPEMRPYFYSRKEINEDDPAYNKALAISEFLLDYFGSILIQRKQYPNVWPTNWWHPYFVDLFANSPLLCHRLKATKEWYIEEMLQLMREGEMLRQKEVSHTSKY